MGRRKFLVCACGILAALLAVAVGQGTNFAGFDDEGHELKISRCRTRI